MKRNLHYLFLAIATATTSGSAMSALHDRGGGLIYDDSLNVTWLQDTTYARTTGYDADGLMNWSNALTWAASLVVVDTLRNKVWDDWRLPRVGPIDGIALKPQYAADGTSEGGYNIRASNNELPHLFYETLGNAAATNPPTADAGPFLHIPKIWVYGQWYWTETTYPYASSLAGYHFDFVDGMQAVSDHSNEHYAWALRDGDVGSITVVPEPSAAALLLAGSLAICCRVSRARRAARR